MGKKLTQNVVVHDDEGRSHAFNAGDRLPDWAADKVDNPKAFEEVQGEVITEPETEPESGNGDAGNGDGGGAGGDGNDDGTPAAPAEFEPTDYSGYNKTQLVEHAKARDIDSSGTVEDIVGRLNAADVDAHEAAAASAAQE